MAPVINAFLLPNNNNNKQDIIMQASSQQVSSREHEFSSPVVIIMVGLPGRGKTVLAHKLRRYLTWIGYPTKVFNVSEYRRKRTPEEYDMSHDFFRSDNTTAVEIRKQSSAEAIDDICEWLKRDRALAILDGTNSSVNRRQQVYEHLVKRGTARVLFVESICEEESIIESNKKDVRENSPDYKDMSEEKASEDFAQKIDHYQDQYEPISSRMEGHYSYIKIFDNGESIMARHIDGHIQGKILYFVSSCKTGPRTLYFSRHGESENNMLGRIGGDADLSCRGQKYAQSLALYMNEAMIPGLRILTSQLKRTQQTVAGINSNSAECLANLNELEAGVCEGLTYEEMAERYPQEFAWRDQDKLRYRYPWGESYVDIMARVEPVLIELERSTNLLVVSHQAVLRCLLGYFLDKNTDDLPYLDVPLHTIIKLTIEGNENKLEFIKLPVECVDTYRKRPKNCAANRSQEEALVTVPEHFDNNFCWEGDK